MGIKFEPEAGRTLLFVGQSTPEMDAYVQLPEVADPAGFMVYTNIITLEGMRSAHQGLGKSDGGHMDFQHWVKNYPNTAMSLALYVVGHLDAINAGAWDHHINDLADMIKECNKPVYLRIAYEVDGPWNAYEPESMKQAWIRIHDMFEAKGVDNVAYLWHAANGGTGTYQDHPIDSWYPGDDYVDWIGTSWFGWLTAPQAGEAQSCDEVAAAAREEIAQFAKDHHKPLAIAESTPRIYYQDNWNEFYQPMFDWVAEHDVKLVSYINQNWLAQGMWAGENSEWGESRVQVDSTVYPKWQEEVNSDRYIGPNDDLYGSIGFSPKSGSSQ